MSDKDQHSLDLLGIKPVGEAVNTIVKGTVEGASAFLSRICLPAAEEFGFLLREKVSHWRSQNLIKIAEKAEKTLKALPDSANRRAPPRLACMALENGSWSDSDDVQEMWAGLLASACTEEGLQPLRYTCTFGAQGSLKSPISYFGLSDSKQST